MFSAQSPRYYPEPVTEEDEEPGLANLEAVGNAQADQARFQPDQPPGPAGQGAAEVMQGPEVAGTRSAAPNPAQEAVAEQMGGAPASRPQAQPAGPPPGAQMPAPAMHEPKAEAPWPPKPAAATPEPMPRSEAISPRAAALIAEFRGGMPAKTETDSLKKAEPETGTGGTLPQPARAGAEAPPKAEPPKSGTPPPPATVTATPAERRAPAYNPNARAAGAPARTPPVLPNAAPGAVKPPNRAEAATRNRERMELEWAKKNGVVIKQSPSGHESPARHPDKTMVFKPAIVRKDFVYNDKGSSIRYRDDHNKEHEVLANDMWPVTDKATGKVEYELTLRDDENNVIGHGRVPEEDVPLIKTDPNDGMRWGLTPEGGRHPIGYDSAAVGKANLPFRKMEAKENMDERVAQMEELTTKEADRQQRLTAARDRMEAAKEELRQMEDGGLSFREGPDGLETVTRGSNYEEVVTHENDPDTRAYAEAWMGEQKRATERVKAAEADYAAVDKEGVELKQQTEKAGQMLVADNRLRQQRIREAEGAALGGQEAPHQKHAREAGNDAEALNRELEGKVENVPYGKEVRDQMMSPGRRQVRDAMKTAFGHESKNSGGTLTDILGQTPGGKAEADRVAQEVLGVKNADSVHVTQDPDGSRTLARKGEDGQSLPFARLDADGSRLTLTRSADGAYSPEAAALLQNVGPETMPLYKEGSEQPFSKTEVSALNQKGGDIVAKFSDRREAEAELTRQGLDPQGIDKMVDEGRLSLQEATRLNNRFNGGANSYAERDEMEKSEKMDQGLGRAYEQADKKNPRSWLKPGDHKNDHVVKTMAKKLDLPEEEVRQELERRRYDDWSTPLTRGGKIEDTRVRPDGKLRPNPELGGNRERFNQAIDASAGSAEEKERVKGQWDAYHKHWAGTVLPTLETMETYPGIENFKQWRQRGFDEQKFSPETSNEELADKYMQEQKDRHGLVRTGDNLLHSFVSGGHGLTASGAGVLAAVTKALQLPYAAEEFSDFAAGQAGLAERSTQALKFTGNDSNFDKVLSFAAKTAPSLSPIGIKGPWASAILGSAQSLGGVYTTGYRHQREVLGKDYNEASNSALKDGTLAGVASLGVSRFFDKIGPSGSRPLNTPETREALKGPLIDKLKRGVAQVPERIKKAVTGEFGKTAVDGLANHVIDSSAAGKGMDEALTDYAENWKEKLGTVGLAALVKSRAEKNWAKPAQAQIDKHVETRNQLTKKTDNNVYQKRDLAAAKEKIANATADHLKKVVQTGPKNARVDAALEKAVSVADTSRVKAARAEAEIARQKAADAAKRVGGHALSNAQRATEAEAGKKKGKGQSRPAQ